MDIAKKIYQLAYYAFLAAFVGLLLLFTITLLPIPGNIEAKIVQSGSMEPTLPTGSVVIIRPQAAYQVGDIVTFGADTLTKVPTTHRIVARSTGRQGNYITQGDANEEPDRQPLWQREIIGRVLFHLPYFGYLIDFARTGLGFVLLVILPITIIAAEEIGKIVREIRRVRPKKRGGGVGSAAATPEEEI